MGLFIFFRAILRISAAYAIIQCPSVCPSVRHVCGSCKNVSSELVHHRVASSYTILVFSYQTSRRFSDRDPRNGGVECNGGIIITIFDQYRFFSELMQNRAIVTMEGE